jgi:putative ABC transport system permease protein
MRLISNYFRLAYRQLSKTRGFTLLNILGLTLGLTTFLLIILYVADEWSYDRFNTKADRIYRVVTDIKANGQISHYADAAPPVAPILQKNYPQVEQAVRVLPQNINFRNGTSNQEIRESNVSIVDPDIFSVFTLPMIEGNPATALQHPHTVVLTETTAKRYFNSTHIIGRTLTDLDDGSVLTVTGVIRDMPVQAHFHADFFISMRGNGMEKNTSFNAIYPMSTYVLLKPSASATVLQQKLSSFMYTWNAEYREYDTSGFFVHLSLSPLTDIHLRSNSTDEIGSNGNIQYVYIFSAIAIFVLLIAAINFMNLSTARSAGRAREVGVRKVLGSPRRQLIAQFLSESLLVTLAATALALLLTSFLLPWFNQLADKSLAFDRHTLTWLLPSLLLIIVIVGLLAGAYPAFFLSSFRPIEVLKGKLTSGFKGSALRSTLVVFQFSISLFLIIGTLVIYRQLHYIQSKDLGFDRDRMLNITSVDALPDPAILKQEVRNLPGVTGATLSSFLPTNNFRWHNFGSIKGGPQGLETQFWEVDPDYLPTLDMKLIRGRNFSAALATDSFALLINEAAANIYGIAQDPLNKTIAFSFNGRMTPFHTIGVIKDFNFNTLRDNVTPLVMTMNQLAHDDKPTELHLKIRTDNLPALMGKLKAKWAALAPHRVFGYSFMDADFDALYRSEQRMGELSVLFSALAIIIACLGLFGLAAYAAEQRTKEIGIRKVLGANVTGIVTLLSGDFLRLIALSILIASPLAWWLLQEWLQGFAYRTTIDAWLFVAAAALILVIAMATTIFQSLRAAVANPVDSLRAE